MQHLFQDGSTGIHHGQLHRGPKTEWIVQLYDEFKLVQGHGGNPWIHNEEEVSSILRKFQRGVRKSWILSLS